jgi:hypothetical protein
MPAVPFQPDRVVSDRGHADDQIQIPPDPHGEPLAEPGWPERGASARDRPR